jgi:ABC-type multidrug transport system ATPase subunit
MSQARPDQTARAILEVRGVAKAFKRRHVLAGLDLTVERGRIIGITGENGSGKTTLLKLLVCLLRPDGGDMWIGGRVGYCPQDPLVFQHLTVRENFAFFAAAYGLRNWIDPMTELLRRFRFEASETALVSEVSGGTRQKLNLCLALLHDPDLLLLDEPYSGFDWETYLEFWSNVQEWKAQGKGLLVVSHFIYDRSRLDDIYDLRDGRLQWVSIE